MGAGTRSRTRYSSVLRSKIGPLHHRGYTPPPLTPDQHMPLELNASSVCYTDMLMSRQIEQGFFVSCLIRAKDCDPHAKFPTLGETRPHHSVIAATKCHLKYQRAREKCICLFYCDLSTHVRRSATSGVRRFEACCLHVYSETSVCVNLFVKYIA